MTSTEKVLWSFEAAAEVVRARSLGLCEVCGKAGNQTHHRQPRGAGGVSGEGLRVNSPAALLRACTDCHNRIEHYREWARRQGYLVPGVGRGTAGYIDPATVPARLRTVNGSGWYLLVEAGHVYSWQDLDDSYSATDSYSGSEAAA